MKNQHLTECQLSGKALSGLAYFACWPAFLRKLAVQTDWAKHSERGGMKRQRGRKRRATSWGYLLSSAQLGRIVLGDKLQSNLDNKCFSTAA